MLRLLVLLLVALAAQPQAQSRTLDIYWVDVEGGAATLFVAPSGESMLTDTGFDVGDRDAMRIAAAAKAAGLRRIDHVVISHCHTDHVGGLTALAKLVPLGRIYSPGDKIEPANQKWLDAVRATAGDRRTIVKPGDTVPLSGVEVQIVASDEALIRGRCEGAARMHSAPPPRKRPPVNRLGQINNGPRKGLGQIDANAKVTTPAGRKVAPYERNGYARLMRIPGIEGVWQGHLSLLDREPGHNTAADMIANMEETADCKGHWIKASVQPNGQFTVTNGRNRFSRTYTSRRS
jgi:hypothetical protein